MLRVLQYRGLLINFQYFKDREGNQILFVLVLILGHVRSSHEENISHNKDDNQIKNYEFNSLIVCIFSCKEFFRNVTLVRRLHHYQKVTSIHTKVTQP